MVPSLTHRFLVELEKRKYVHSSNRSLCVFARRLLTCPLPSFRKLLRIYTQNIDGLETIAGVSPKRVVECHGSLHTSKCIACKHSVPTEEISDFIERGEVARCKKCTKGVYKPGITFFGEAIDNRVKRLLEADKEKTDLLLVMGTSLKVPYPTRVDVCRLTLVQVKPMSNVVGFLHPNVPQILINLTQVKPSLHLSEGFDVSCVGSSDAVVNHLCKRLGWDFTRGMRCDVSEASERVFRFAQGEGAEAIDSEEEVDVEVEVVTCDMCGKMLTEKGWSCKQCFDYDLCTKCYSRGKNPHKQATGHRFSSFKYILN